MTFQLLKPSSLLSFAHRRSLILDPASYFLYFFWFYTTPTALEVVSASCGEIDQPALGRRLMASTLHRGAGRPGLPHEQSRGEANTSTDYPPSATAPCWHAFGGGRVLAAGAPRVPPAAHPSSPPPPGQHARVIGRVSVIPPNAAPSSMRLQECTDLRRLSVHQLQLQRTAKTPLTGSPRHSCVTPRSHGPLLPRRHREPQRPPTASCAMHCTPLCARPPPGTHAHRTCAAAPHSSGAHALLPTRELTPKLRAGRFSRRGDSGVGSKGHRCKAG